MYKFPLRIPSNRGVEITQAFKSKELVDFYKSKGLDISEHNAIDVTCGDAVATYGTPFVCPFSTATLVNYTEAEPAKGISGRVLIKYIEADGTELILGGIHLSGTVKQDVYKEGDILGYIGNYGYVLPEPTIGQPFLGSHIHLTLLKNGVVVDPLLYFNPQDPYRGEDTGNTRDIFAIYWAFQKIKEYLAKLGLSTIKL